MLTIAKKMNELSFGQLMEVYVEGCLERGQELYPEEPEPRQIALGEQEFYQYLHQVFFRTQGAVYAMWEVDGKYASALRLEPYRDGLLLEALETAPCQRRRGHAKNLILKVMERTGGTIIYSHVSKSNLPSIKTHESCGFRKRLNYAVCADGSVMHHMYTYCFEPNT